MTLKDDVRKKTGAFLTSSQEIFEKIFAQATRELSIRKKPKPIVQKPVPAPSADVPLAREKKPKVTKASEKTAVTYTTSEKVKAKPSAKPRPTPKTGGGSHVLRAGLLFVLLLVLAGFAANHFAIIDLNAIPALLGLGPKPVVQAPIPGKQPAKPPEKAASAPKQAQESLPTAAPTPSAPTPPALSKEEKLVELETPTTVAQSPAVEERIEEKTPSFAPQAQPSPPGSALSKIPQPVHVQAHVSEKPSAPEAIPLQPGPPQYPYSVYLGSFKTPDAVKKALSDYQEKGLSVYLARVDLGDKGVWYRFFTGYFLTKAEAEKYIRERNLQGAEPATTRYANLIGVYGSDKEAEDQKRLLVPAGFYPYVIKGADGKSLVYSGAFDRKEYAEKERNDLASKGIRSEVVER